MRRLSEKKFWNSIYKIKTLEDEQNFSKKNLKILTKRLLNKKTFNYVREYMIRSYVDHLLWDVIYKKYMPKTKGLKALEVGSAPGDYLVRLSQEFGFIPYGIEYSDAGVELNRKIFSLHKIDPDNVIHADFLSDEFHRRYREYFDIVISNGFIEHFTDVKDIIGKHINLLNKGGYLIVSIPNFKGVNYILAWVFNRHLLSTHNIDIITKRRFSGLFDSKRLAALYCDYYGTFNFDLFNNRRNSPRARFVLSFCNGLQLILNVIFRVLFRDKSVECGFFSPYLLLIAVKR